MTQRELAQAAGLSYSLVRKVEQGDYGDIRLETARKLAAALSVPTTALMSEAAAGEQQMADGTLWAPTSEAIIHPQRGEAAEPFSERGLADALLAAVKLYHDNRYEQLASVLPRLLAEGEDASPLLRSRILQLGGSVMVQTRQRDAARAALNRSLADAESTGSALDAASAVITLCWLLLSEGKFEQVRRLSAEWGAAGHQDRGRDPRPGRGGLAVTRPRDPLVPPSRPGTWTPPSAATSQSRPGTPRTPSRATGLSRSTVPR
jgi:transcriptional regulator with XRE-family HTH domain